MAAHDFLFNGVQRVAHFNFTTFELLREMLGDLRLDLLFARVALGTLKGFEHPFNLGQRVFANGGLYVVARQLQREFALFNADFSRPA